YALTALAVGARAIGLADGLGAVDTVAARVDALAERVSAAADRSADRVAQAVDRAAGPRDGTIALAVRDALARLGTELDGLVAGEDAPLRAALARQLKAASDDAAARVERALASSAEAVRAALSPTDPAGPLSALRDEVRRAGEQTRRDLGEQLAEVRTFVAVARENARMVEKTSAKGASYEASVVGALVDLAHVAGDTVDATGDRIGLVANAKTGDAVVTVGPGTARGLDIRVVAEAKDAALSAPRWAAELANGRRNRGAVAGLGVVRGAARMPGGRRVHVIDACNIVVAWDPADDGDDLLCAAYLLVRAGAVQAALAGSGDDVDRAAIAETLAAAYAALAGFDAVDKAAGTARRGLDDLGRAADALRATLHGHLARGLRLASPAPRDTP
ncbi:MAG: hypothetical protein LC789_13360, partial [Actinobacteria bacterium]|nr:hypothetical protein [Actinomycetota bacterium]MCA1721155.1 hypothetical protein [Actinomycetota bacterium]